MDKAIDRKFKLLTRNLPWRLVVGRQGYNDKYRGLVTVDFILSYFSAANPGTTAIWELEVFLLVAGPVGRRQGYNCNLGTRDFLGAAVGRRQGYNCNQGTRDFLVAGPVAIEIFWVASPVGK